MYKGYPKINLNDILQGIVDGIINWMKAFNCAGNIEGADNGRYQAGGNDLCESLMQRL